MRRFVPAITFVLVAACSAPALPADLADAERHVRRGQHDQALAAYAAAQRSCKQIKSARLRRSTCSSAHLGRAELLVTLGRREQAATAYEKMPPVLVDDPPAAAQALFRAGELALDLGHTDRAYRLLWKTVTDYPGEAFAADALRLLLRDGRQRDARQLYDVLGQLATAMADSEVADNLLFALADLAENEFGDRGLAGQLYDKLVERYPDSGLFDESLWHGARLARQSGDGRGATARLRRLLATREVALGAGSYFSVWLDDAQLELGRVLRDDLADYKGAIAAFRQLAEDYPASILRDDALFERAVTWQTMGDAARACKDLHALHKGFPDSKFELERAPAMRRELGCVP